MRIRLLLLIGLAAACLAPTSSLGLHSAGNGVVTTDSGARSFTTEITTPIWWDYAIVGGVPTGLRERTAMLEVNAVAPFLVTAETFPSLAGTDTPKICPPAGTPEVDRPPAVVHAMSCVKDNGYSVQIHYFPWSADPNDPDHVISPTAATPLAVASWHVDAVPLSYKTALIPAGHWQIWIDPAVAPPLPYSIRYQVTSGTGFYFDYLGFRGCPFYAVVAPGVSDIELLGCPSGYV
ncbi:MAG: hypothetical protein LC624_01875 [Halobacteriales archaeon]|nr:hypothetical protein [Halobacteriales archaeon]